MDEVGLRLHPAKTKIVYWRDDRRRGSHEHKSFTFLSTRSGLDLVIQSTRRFLDLHGAEAGDLSTAAAAQAPEIGRLVLRAYTQASGAIARAAALDLIDGLLLSGTYDMAQLVDEAER